MIAETSKEVATIDIVIKFYLKGFAFEPLFLDNVIDLAQVCFQLNENSLGNLLLLLAKILQSDEASSDHGELFDLDIDGERMQVR